VRIQRRQWHPAYSFLNAVSVTVALVIGLAVTVNPARGGERADGSRVRTVQGEIVAINVEDSPNVIVVRVTLPGKKELIVGATVKATTAISRRSQHVRLENLKVGETVVLTYLKGTDGLAAHSIEAH
jgi:hypothetical protein